MIRLLLVHNLSGNLEVLWWSWKISIFGILYAINLKFIRVKGSSNKILLRCLLSHSILSIKNIRGEWITRIIKDVFLNTLFRKYRGRNLLKEVDIGPEFGSTTAWVWKANWYNYLPPVSGIIKILFNFTSSLKMLWVKEDLWRKTIFQDMM